MDKQREEQAINAYTKFLQSKGVNATGLEIRKQFVTKLVVLLEGQTGRSDYARALQTIIKIEENIDPSKATQLCT